MKICLFLLCIFLLSCRTTEKITIKIKPYLVKAANRDALQVEAYPISKETTLFAQNLDIDTAVAFYRSFNHYQSLYNSWKRNEIDSIVYWYKLLRLKKEDSVALSKGYKISELVPFLDTTMNAEVKVFIGINKRKKNIIVIVDENNNNSFTDDKLTVVDTINYKNVFDTLQFKVTNLSAFYHNVLQSFQLPVMINQLSNSDMPKVFSELFNLNPWICASQYFKGKKRISGERIYFDFKKFIYNYNDSWCSTIVSKSPINRGVLNNTLYEGDYIKINDLLYHIDSCNTRKVYLSVVKKTTSSDRDLLIPVF